METENASKMPILIVIVFLIFCVVGGLTWYLAGSKGFLSFLIYFMITMMIVFVIFLIILAVWWLMSKQRIDTVHVNKQRVLKACHANPPSTASTIWFRGNDEWESKCIGFVTGVCRLVFKKTIKTEVKGNMVDTVENHYEDAISFRKSKGVVASLLSSDSMVRVLPEERSNLNGDKIYLKGMAFAPEKYGFFFLSSRFQYDDPVNKLVAEIRHVTLQEVLKEAVNIANDAIAISPAHQKALEKSNMQSINQPAAGTK